MAANRTIQQKRRSGCLKGGSATEADVASLASSEAGSGREAGIFEPSGWESPRYSLSQGAGLKIRLTMRHDAAQDGNEEAEPASDSVESAQPHADVSAAAAAAAAAAAPFMIESDSEELLEEEGDSEEEIDNDEDAPMSAGKLEQQQQCQAPHRGRTIEIIWTLDEHQQQNQPQQEPMVLFGSIESHSVEWPIKQLKPIASVPLESAKAATSAALATIRGLGLAGLVDKLHDRRVGLLVEASYEALGDRDGEVESPLILLPAARLPWASLTLHNVPADSASPAGSEASGSLSVAVAAVAAASAPDWWHESDGPVCEVNLNSLRRSDIFKQQFGD